MTAPTGTTVTLAFDEVGSGPPLLILHGLLGQARNWASQAKLFGQHYRTLAVDLRNHGRSPWAAGMTYEDMAADVAALAEAVGPPVRIVGHSMGGKVTMALALTTLVSCDAIVYPPELPFRAAELEELDDIAVAKFSALEELDDCTDVIVVTRIATEECSCFC